MLFPRQGSNSDGKTVEALVYSSPTGIQLRGTSWALGSSSATGIQLRGTSWALGSSSAAGMLDSGINMGLTLTGMLERGTSSIPRSALVGVFAQNTAGNQRDFLVKREARRLFVQNTAGNQKKTCLVTKEARTVFVQNMAGNQTKKTPNLSSEERSTFDSSLTKARLC